MEAFFDALGAIFSWQGMFLLWSATILALIMGMLPGLSSTECMLILLPFTFSLGLGSSMILLNAAYGAGFIGGAVTSIMFGIPGSSTSIATVLDGYPMRQQGRAMEALGAANVASLLGGLFALVIVACLMPLMGPASLLFGPPEWFVFVLFGLVVLAFAGEGTFGRAIVSAALGILAGCIGLSSVTGSARFSLGSSFLWGGIPIIPAFIGLYPFAEAMDLAFAKFEQGDEKGASARTAFRDQMRGALRTFQNLGHVVQGTLTGWFIGVVPGVGGTLANMMGYIIAKQSSKHPESFGKGNVAGVIASEAANNASTAGALIPALALGIPGSLNTAVLLGLFLINGIQPGTNVFEHNLGITWVILLSVAFSTLFSALIVLFGGWQIVRFTTKVNMKIVVLVVVVLGCIATYLSRTNIGDLFVALLLALIGIGMKRYNFSRISFIIALMLADLFETSFFQSLSIGRGSYSIFFKGPVVLTLWTLTAAVGGYFCWNAVKARARRQEMEA